MKATERVLVKLGSIARHTEEFLETWEASGDVTFDREAIRGLLADPEVVALMEDMDRRALLPVKR
jgi:hypothetical protein